MIVKTALNPYFSYDKEPFTLYRVYDDDKKYVCGKEIFESLGVSRERNIKNYLRPTEEVLEKIKEYEANKVKTIYLR